MSDLNLQPECGMIMAQISHPLISLLRIDTVGPPLNQSNNLKTSSQPKRRKWPSSNYTNFRARR
jgi:hypothetical protein